MDRTKYGRVIELKQLDTESGTFTGYAAKFGNVDHGGDLILPGAFANSLKAKGASDIPILWQHKDAEPIGVTEEISEDSDGLVVKGRLVMEVQRAREASALAKAGAIKGLSIGYITKDWAWQNGVRVLKEVDLLEYSMVTFPMNDRATITSAKSIEVLESLADCEAYLRDACGLSRTEAKTLISRIRRGRDDVAADESEELKQLARKLEALNQQLITGA